MRALILLCAALGACASPPYRADLATHGDVKVSTDLVYFIVEANGDASVQAVEKSSGTVVWERTLPAGTRKVLKRSGKTFTEVSLEEARAALGIRP